MRDCVRVAFGSPWFDTVDQEHVPIRVTNACDSEIKVELEALTPQGSAIQRFSLSLPPNSTREVEVVTDLYLQKLIVRGRWREAGEEEWSEVGELEIVLR